MTNFAGIMEDNNNRGRLAKLIRFHTSKFPDTLSSLDEYLGRMKQGQKTIFFICTGSMEEAQRSPFLEKLIEQGYEVILFTEPMDEYMMQVCYSLMPPKTIKGRRVFAIGMGHACWRDGCC